MSGTGDHYSPDETDIAIVGMAAHLPGAASIEAYWRNLREGVESIRRLSEEELRAAGVPEAMLARADYVPHASPLDGFEMFDGEFFGFSPKESAILDPQHRQFLEVAWEAMENAGHVPETAKGPIGVFAGCGMGSYFYFNICSNPELVDEVGMFLLRHTGNDKDFMSTRVSHVFDLKGPSISLQTACSTSLVATHYAAQALLNGECDMALAGGVTIELPQGHGYVFKEGEILSPDGHCHAFDARAQGTVFGSGAGCIVLRRLGDALADGDHIHAVIKGSAVNNDGAAKAGYLAPSVDGQAAAVAEAQAIAGVSAETVDYVECHGTGTYLGDPIEVAALTEAFRETTEATGFCRIGSVKTNIGHLDTAAGVASLIKAALALEHREMPPSLGYESPNPAIDFEHSPFVVNDRLTPWEQRGGPRRAGVNSLGVGGTNAHVVLEEAPEVGESEASDWPFQPLVISGRSKAALDANAKALAAHLRAQPELSLADVAWTLKEGRRGFEKRRVLVAESATQAAEILEAGDPRRVFDHAVLGDAPEVVFMFPGGGAQYAGMARDLYETEPVFAEWMDRGLELLQPRLDYDLKALWLPEPGREAEADKALLRPSVQLPLIMITEYALAQLWMSWGVTPGQLVGHSMGENTAACLAGVMSFEDCIGLVHLRGTLFDEVPAGGMLSVSLPADELRGWLAEGLDLASVNAPGLAVASGPDAALAELQARLEAADIDCQRVQIDIAAHSRMLEPILQRFGDYLRAIRLEAPRLPIISNRSGKLLTEAEATDPDYWVGHLRGTVEFAACIDHLAAEPARIYVEMGPGKALSSLAAQHPDVARGQVISALRHPEDAVPDDAYFIAQLARIWAMGGSFDWGQIWGEAKRRRVELPTYAFQRKPYFIEPGAARAEAAPSHLMRLPELADWGYLPGWKPKAADCDVEIAALETAPKERWLVFCDEAGLAGEVVTRLRDAGQDVVTVTPGDAFGRDGAQGFVLSPERGREGYDALVEELSSRDWEPTRIAHFWLVTEGERHRPGSSFFHRNQEQGFYALLFLAQAMAEADWAPERIIAVTSGAAQARGTGLDYPEKVTLRGPLQVIPREMPGVTASMLDVTLGKPREREGLVERVLEELFAAPGNHVAALREGRRFEEVFRAAELDAAETDALPLREAPVVLITGGFGGIGLTLSERLISERGAKIVLMARQALPPRDEWEAVKRRHGAHDALAQRIEAVERLEAMGGQVMVVAADVSNVEEMRGAVEKVQMRFGAINGVVHAAGVIQDEPLLTKSPMVVEDVFTPKIHGLQVLDHLFPDGALDFMVLFSSTSTVTAPAGQVDYVAANAYLNAYAQARAGGKTHVLALNWGIWAEVGMAAQALGVGRAAPDRSERPAAPPLLDVATFDAVGNRLFKAQLGTDAWVIGEHRTKENRALMPGTGYVELAAQALEAQGESGGFEIRDLYFLAPLEVRDRERREMRLRLERSDAGYDVTVQSAREQDGRTGFETNAQMQLSLLPLPEAGRLDLGEIAARCGAPVEAEPGRSLRSPQEAHLNFGSHWRVLKRKALGQGEGLAHLRLPESAREPGYTLPPGLLDLATGWAMELIEGYQPTHLWVPVSYGSVRVWRPLPDELVSWVRNAGANRGDGAAASFDVTLCDTEGEVCAEITGFSIRRMEGALFGAAQGALEFEGAAADRPLSPAEERLRHNLSQGIRPEEGAEAFMRALAMGKPQVIVSSLALPDLVKQAESDGAREVEAQKFQRPELETDYVAPEGEIEEHLAEFWGALLGVEQVGAQDNFFDLGGHSLIAVRLFALVKKRWAVDFPISVLFEAPTIRACAQMIEAQGVSAGKGKGEQEASEPESAGQPERRFTHLVPMHQGEGGVRRPFFLVAGMFGNVLNLRHLAHLLGTDRPFYGLQARGLLGEDAPHETIPEAAADYLAEMRQVQPEGPYLLGGFSGGGIIAYEIAQQLKAAGEDVALLVMLDTPLPQRRPLSTRDRAAIQLQELKEGGLAYPFRWMARRVAWEISKRRAPETGVEGAPETQFHDSAIEQAFLGAVAGYALRPWDGPLVLFRPPLVGKWEVAPGRWVNSERAYVTHDNDWTPHAPLVEVIEVPGDHDSMVLEPNVRVLAARMRRAIEDAENPRARAGRVAALPLKPHAAE